MHLEIDHQGVWIPWEDGNGARRTAHEQALIERVRLIRGDLRNAVRVAETLGGTAFGLNNDRTATPRSDAKVPRGGPVFVDYPTVKEMGMAVARARGTILAVLEGTGGFKANLGGWAAAVGAINAITGEPTPSPPEEIRTLLEQIAHNGNNGFHDSKYNSGVRVVVPSLARDLWAAGYTTDFIVSYMFAYGLDKDSEKSLRKVIGKN